MVVAKTFLQAAPRLTRSRQELFLDVEGNPDDGFTRRALVMTVAPRNFQIAGSF